MGRQAEIRQAYEYVGSHAERFDNMMMNSSWLGRLAMRWFWQMDDRVYRQYLTQAFAGIPMDFSGRLLEIPVGTGVLSLPIYQALPKARITCCDYSDAMLAAARERAEQQDLRNVDFLQGDVGNLPFSEEAFEIVLSVNGFHVFPDKQGAYRETWRVLKEQGIFCGCMYVQGQNSWTDFFVRNFCERQGYFTPPYETMESLENRLKELYREVRLSCVEAFAGFICKK